MYTSLADVLAPYRRASDFSARRLAEFAGVAPSTVTRIEKGLMQPSFDVARELLTLVGSPLIQVERESVEAIAVARHLIDNVPIPQTPGMAQWRARWQRGGLITDDGNVVSLRARDELLHRTAAVARVTRRPGFRSIPQRSWQQGIRMLDKAGVQSVLSGSPAANMWAETAPEAEALLYVSDMGSAEEVLWGAEKLADSPSVFLLPFDGVSEVGGTLVDGLPLASLTQIVIDCLGLPGRQPAQAEAIMGQLE